MSFLDDEEDLIDKLPVCIDCHHPFQYRSNIFTEAGKRKIYISSICEKCFNTFFEEPVR